MFDIVTVGSNTIDWFLWTDPEIIHRQKRHSREALMAYPVGSKILVKEFNVATGGGGTNTAATFSRLGLRTAYLGRIGEDENGDLVLKDLAKFGIKFIGKRRGFTGFSVILDSAHDRTVLAYKGANDEFTFNEIDRSKLNTKWLYFSSMMGKSYGALVQLARWGKSRGIKVAFNPSSYLAAKGRRFLLGLTKNVDVLVLNREEAEDMAGKLSKERLVQALSSCGPKYVAVTDGSKGVCAWDGSFFYDMPTRNVKVMETLGAGDAFAAGLVTGLIVGRSFVDCLKLGLNNAESCIQIRGAKEGLLTAHTYRKILDHDHRRFVQRRL